jgi:pyruvate formate lyase activating enzyme
VDQDLILTNLEFLSDKGVDILIRCPVIPGINDTEDHFKGITSISIRYPALKGIEILGYHDYGQSKYENLGMMATPIESKTVSQSTLNRWLTELEQMGCKNLVK